MPRRPVAWLLVSAALAACSPTFNWRDVRVEPTALRAMLPCKPDKGARTVTMAGREVELAVVGCDTGGATFAILHADLGDAMRAGEVLQQWNQLTLANMHATASSSRPYAPPGATPLGASQRVSAQGRRADGSPVRGEAAYFAQGGQVFQAVVYAADPAPAAVQPFFEGLKFQ